MASSTAYPCIIMTLLSLSILLFFPSLESASKGGFSVEIIHRDFSPKSPFYNPNENHYQRLYKSLFYHNRAKPDPKALVWHYGGSFLMQMKIGTPPVQILGTLDTGSDWTWTRCVPCGHCAKQKAPLFNSSKSLSYTEIDCESDGCIRFVPEPRCNSHACGYTQAYFDGSYSEGNVALDFITLDLTSPGQTVRKVIMFGCSHGDGGYHMPEATGIISMGGGPTSIVTQLNVSSKFSYCLVQYQAHSSILNFGESADVSGPGTVSTPVVYRDGYYLTIKGGSITGAERIDFPAAPPGQPGNIIIDSGTPQTYLDPAFYQTIRDGVASRIFLPPADPVPGFGLCYNVSSPSLFDSPTITMHFEGADVALTTVNSFVLVGPRTMCFTLQPNTKSKGVNFFGSIAQINFLVGYDSKKVSFKPVDCSSV